ncbi:hypothetical protein G210_0890, partial [Candida maltosa Xu316]
LPEEVIDYYGKKPFPENVDKFAYMQYATNYDYLNLAIINFIHLRNGGTEIPHLVIVYDEILQYYASDKWSDLFQVANHYKITLKSAPLIKANYNDDSNWAASFTKFHIFNQVEYDRIVFFDSDSMFVKIPEDIDFENMESEFTNIDELFKLPKEISFALPQAYWLNKVVEGEKPKPRMKVEIPNKKRYSLRMKKLVSDLESTNNFNALPSVLYENHKLDNPEHFFANHIMVITPSKSTFNKIMKYVYNPWWWSFTNRANLRKDKDYDMEILNKFLDNELRNKNINVGILPHRVYGVLTGEFGEEWHERFVVEPQYLPFINKKSNKGWNPIEFFKKIKMVHFSDNPIPKPWEEETNDAPYNTKKIYCANGDMEKYNKEFPTYKPRLTDDCDSVDIWNWIRKEFYRERKGYWYVE